MDNSKTIGTLNVWQQLLVSFFQTVTMRTAGFATISYTNANFTSNLLFMIQMIIGGGPGGTAGGIKGHHRLHHVSSFQVGAFW